ncbi:MAG: hypothetical protein JSW02_03330 [candidate division WOR-3 bacterium]|nr:MAG: hypothetical protein JSW02_03330 [candidate division WOR-3 bacterium]
MKKLVVIAILISIVVAQGTFTLLKIDRKTEAKLATLFEELPERIDLYLTEDSVYVVEAIYENRKLVEKLTPDEYRELMATEPEKLVILENERVRHLVNQTLLGLGIYSWSLPVAIGAEDRGGLAIGLLTPLVYTSFVYATTSRIRISRGAAEGAMLGGLAGAAHGGLLFRSERTIFVGSIAENLTDFMLGQKGGYTEGMFQRKFNHCLYGYYHYIAAKTLAVGWEDDDVWEDGEDIATFGSALSLVEGYAALILSKNDDYLTYGDATFELRTAIIGAEFVPLIMATFDLHREEMSDERIYAATSLAGFGLGYLWGRKLSREYDLSEGAASMTWLIPYLAHTATGGLIALTESEDLARTYPIIFLAMDLPLTYICYKTFAERPTGYGNVDTHRFNIAFNPAFFVLRDKMKGNVPLVAVSYYF